MGSLRPLFRASELQQEARVKLKFFFLHLQMRFPSDSGEKPFSIWLSDVPANNC